MPYAKGGGPIVINGRKMPVTLSPETIDTLSKTGLPIAAAVRRSIDRHQTILKIGMQTVAARFPDEELSALRVVLAGTSFGDGLTYESALTMLSQEIVDTDPDDWPFRADRNLLASKLRSLNPAEAAAIIDMTERARAGK